MCIRPKECLLRFLAINIFSFHFVAPCALPLKVDPRYDVKAKFSGGHGQIDSNLNNCSPIHLIIKTLQKK